MIAVLPAAGPVVVSLPVDSCLVRRFKVSKALTARLSQLAQLDLQRVLPIPIEDVVAAIHAVEEGEVLAVEQVVMRRADFAALTELFAGDGVQLRAVTFRRRDGTWLPAVLDPSGAPFSAQAHGRWRMAFAASLLAMVAAGGLLAATVTMKSTSQVARIEAAMVELSPRIEAVKARIAEYRESSAAYRQVQDWRSAHDSVLKSIEELSGILPDHTYLSSLAYDGRKIVVDGFSQSPETLISVLEGSDLFSGATFTSPVYRDAGQELSRISVSVDAGVYRQEKDPH